MPQSVRRTSRPVTNTSEFVTSASLMIMRLGSGARARSANHLHERFLEPLSRRAAGLKFGLPTSLLS
jgi:hypothetical protein